jgi:hypothetical protein
MTLKKDFSVYKKDERGPVFLDDKPPYFKLN